MPTTALTPPSPPDLPTAVRDRQLLDRALAHLATLDGWRDWLAVRSAFPDRSLHNQALIALQHPTATRLATFRAWANSGYIVQKRPDEVPEGQYAVRQWEPRPPSRPTLKAWREAGSDPATYPPTVFALTNLFAQDQVAPAPEAPQTPAVHRTRRDLDGDDLAAIAPALTALAATLGPLPSLAAALPPNARVAALCQAIGQMLVTPPADPDEQSSQTAEPFAHTLDHVAALRLHLDQSDTAVLTHALASVCIRGLGLDPDAVLADASSTVNGTIPQRPIDAARFIDACARIVEAAVAGIEIPELTG